MRFTILTLILLLGGCTVTSYQPRIAEPLIIERHHDPVRIIIHPRHRYGAYYYRNSYIHRPVVRVPKHYHYHNGIRVHKKNYWSKTTKNPQKESTTERRHNWRHRKKQQNSKGR